MSDSIKVKLKLSIPTIVTVKIAMKDYEALSAKIEEDGSVPLEDTSIYGKVINSIELDVDEVEAVEDEELDD